MVTTRSSFAALALSGVLVFVTAAVAQDRNLMPIGQAWAANTINCAIFRNDAITTHEDHQYAAYYDPNGNVVIASRQLGQRDWKRVVTNLNSDVKDAHNVI